MRTFGSPRSRNSSSARACCKPYNFGSRNFPQESRYEDASWVGYRLAELLPLPLSIKQSMLEINDANIRLSSLAQFLERQGLLQAL